MTENEGQREAQEHKNNVADLVKRQYTRNSTIEIMNNKLMQLEDMWWLTINVLCINFYGRHMQAHACCQLIFVKYLVHRETDSVCYGVKQRFQWIH